MKLLSILLTLVFVCTVQTSFAQELELRSVLDPRSELSPAPIEVDKALQSRMDDSRRHLLETVKNYLVAFDARDEGEHKRVGLPLTALSTGRFTMAYDVGGRSVMMQWKPSSASVEVKKLNYHAYLGESGSVHFVIKARF